MEIGETFRRLRRERNLTIDDLMAATGLSRSYISQIENNRASPSISTLRKLCAGLEVSPALLFEDPDASCTVIRADKRRILHFETVQGDAVHTKMIHMLSESNRKLEFVMIELSAGHTAGDHAHPGEEIFFVLDGEITLTYGDEKHHLNAGDSVHIESQRHHMLHNRGKSTARLLSARTPPGFVDLKHDETMRRADK